MNKIEKYNPKYDLLIKEYLNKIKQENYYDYYLTINQIKFFAYKKELFLVIKNNKIENIFYKSKDLKQLRFLFEYPKEKYSFIDDYPVVCVSFLSPEKIDKSFCFYYSVDVILDNKQIILLKGAKYKNLRTKIKQAKKNNLEVLDLDKEKIILSIKSKPIEVLEKEIFNSFYSVFQSV